MAILRELFFRSLAVGLLVSVGASLTLAADGVPAAGAAADEKGSVATPPPVKVKASPKPYIPPALTHRGLHGVHGAPHPSASPAVEPSPHTSASAVPTPAPSVVKMLTQSEAKSLLSEFQKAQASELKALDHQNKMELVELQASQNARYKEWKKKEADARHAFFETHKAGAEQRKYVQDFIQRRDALFAILADEKASRAHEQEVRRKSFREEQDLKLREFKEFLGHGERPPARLWPH